MFCLNLPKKTVSMIQVWVSILLIVVSIFLAFTPIITFDLLDEETASGIEEMLSELGGEKIELPEGKLEVTAPKLIGCISMITKVISVSTNSNATQAERDELQAMIEGEEGKNALMIAAAVAVTFGDAFEGAFGEETGSDNIIGTILNIFLEVFVVLFATLYMFGFTLIIPFVYIIVGIVALIRALTKLQTPEEAAGKVGKALPGMVVYPMMLLAFQAVLPTMGFGSGALVLWILAFVATFLNVVVSRLRTYAPNDMKYANVLQGVSLVSVIGYLVFFFNIIKTGVFNTFTHGPWSGLFGTAMAYSAVAEKTGEAVEFASNGYIIDPILVVLAVGFVLSSFNYFSDILQRLSLAKPKGGDSGLVPAIFVLASCVLPMIVKSSQNNYKVHEFVVTNGNTPEPVGSFLDGMTAEGESALTMALVGAIILLASEIALIVLKKVFCADIDSTSREAVLRGTALTNDEKIAAAEATVAAARATLENAAPAAPVVEEAPAAEEVPVAAEATEEVAEENTEA